MSVETMKDIINYAAEQYGDQDAFRYKVKKEIHGKTYRQLKGLTQEQTARVVGVSQVQISRLERRGLKRLRETFEE